MNEESLDNIGLEVYIAKINDISKGAEALIPIALELLKLEEWKAFREIVKIKSAQRMREHVFGSGAATPEDRGFIRGMEFVIDLLEIHLPQAMERKKSSLLTKTVKPQDLTESQA